MKKPLYKHLSTYVDAWHRCQKTGSDWLNLHEETIKELLKSMPHGTGIDYDWWIDLKNSSGEKLIFGNYYHYMDERGFYDGVYGFTCTVTPSLQFGFNLKITFDKGIPKVKKEEIKEYIEDIIESSLCEETEI